MHKVIFIFIDGLGLAPLSDINPIHHISMPILTQYCGVSLNSGCYLETDSLVVKPIDACLNVDGVPQSATGQTTLFTGKNAAQILGHHYPAFPPHSLKKIINDYSFLKQLTELNIKCLFANFFSQSYFDLIKAGKRHHSASTLATIAAGLSFKTVADLKSGDALSWDITRETVLSYIEDDIAIIEPETAAEQLLAMSRYTDLLFFETFKTDLLGHRHNKKLSEDFLTILDRFLGCLVKQASADTSLLITSDHGNIEDTSHGAHTFNDVPLIVTNQLLPYFKDAESLIDITPKLVQFYKQFKL